MPDPRRPTNPTVQQQLHNLELQFVEFRAEVMSAIRELRADLSDQGKTPKPADRAGTTGKWTLPAIPPGAALQYAMFAGAITSAILGPILAFYGGSSGGSSGATTAVETAVEQGEAVPVAPPPTIRVVPVPIAVPVTVEEEDPPVAAPPSDLLPDLRP